MRSCIWIIVTIECVSLRIQSECEKMRARITPNTDTFHAVYIMIIVLNRRLMMPRNYLFLLQGCPETTLRSYPYSKLKHI